MEMVGNVTEIKALKALLSQPDHIQTFLFTGDRGCGKTLSARLLAVELGASIREINASDDRGIETIRSIIDECSFVSNEPILYILDECHQLSAPAQEALLKIFQDTPKGVYFALCTTNPEKLKEPLKSRCHKMELERLRDKDIIVMCNKIDKIEGFGISFDTIEIIADLSEGSAREALVMLESVLGLTNEEASSKLQGNPETRGDAIEICRAMLDSNTRWPVYAGMLRPISTTEVEGVRQLILSYMTTVLLSKGEIRVAKILDIFAESFYNSGKSGLVSATFKVFKLKEG
jgi:DNA polymerase III delta prime subunit